MPLGEATRRATDFVAQYVLRGGDTSTLEDEIKAVDRVASRTGYYPSSSAMGTPIVTFLCDRSGRGQRSI